MKRDMDLIRRIALEVADMEHGYVLDGLEDGTSKADFAMHVIWMVEADLITANVQEYMSGEPAKVQVKRLTWAGCEFVDAIRDDTLWNKAKENVMKPTMSFTFGIVKDWLKAEITQGLPTLRTFGQQGS